jgi:hypothetical protein
MNYDELGDEINGKETYKTIAKTLANKLPIIIGWTDGNGVHYDILFNTFPIFAGHIQGGLHNNYIYMSIIRVGTWGFRAHLAQSVHASYIEEKLGVQQGQGAEQLADLINAIKEYL